MSVFDQQAEEYDAWYDTPKGRAIFAQELEALQPLLDGLRHPWLEVGVGSGRFAAALGIEVGVDPARRALNLAARRGITTIAARAEQLPFPDASFGAVLFMVTLCFVAEPVAALREARRVLRLDGGLVLGLLLAEGPWGQYYQTQAAAGHPYYQGAHFFTRAELGSLLTTVGLQAVRTRSALFGSPRAEPVVEPAQDGDDRAAGFTALLATPGQRQQAR
jgi:ubiquinone/menaquinone biosynthesis C-methylase UbiE